LFLILKGYITKIKKTKRIITQFNKNKKNKNKKEIKNKKKVFFLILYMRVKGTLFTKRESKIDINFLILIKELMLL